MMTGIDVGHQFFSRAEMVVVGFHQHWLNGIDFIGQTASKSRKKGVNLHIPHMHSHVGFILKIAFLLQLTLTIRM